MPPLALFFVILSSLLGQTSFQYNFAKEACQTISICLNLRHCEGTFHHIVTLIICVAIPRMQRKRRKRIKKNSNPPTSISLESMEKVSINRLFDK